MRSVARCHRDVSCEIGFREAFSPARGCQGGRRRGRKRGATAPKTNDEIARSDRADHEIELRVASANEEIRSSDIVIGGAVTEFDLIIGSAGA